MSSSSLIRPVDGPGPILQVTPASAGWDYLEFGVVDVTAVAPWSGLVADRETAVVALAGEGRVIVGGNGAGKGNGKGNGAGKVRSDGKVNSDGKGKGSGDGEMTVPVSRSSVFEQLSRIVYVPPGTPYRIESESGLRASVGSAPAEGRYPARVFEPSEMRIEIRGGGQAHRQVIHSLAHPLPAERLILYEVYVPRGTWSGWPPHCHDGRDGSPYLEEVYYFRLDRPEGYAIHRNWRDDESYDDAMVVTDGDVALVPKGYHTSVACPGSNMYFLNYLAGEPTDDERRTPPCFAAEHTWIEADWTAGQWGLPVVSAGTPR